jgi:H+/Cl- antiporter ClcA
MHHVASAALPVAIGLLVCAAAARAVLWWGLGDQEIQAQAREHLEPLCVWCLGALVVYVFARTATGGSLLTSLFVGSALGAVILALWQGAQEPAPTQEQVAEPPPEPPAPAEPPPPDERPRQGLWSRGLPG